MLPSSTLSPDHDSATIASSPVIMPRSPWLASLGCTKKAGVPVEAKVAASFWLTCPLLPMPVTITRPLAAASVATARPKAAPSSCSSARLSACRPSHSRSSVRAAEFRAAAGGGTPGCTTLNLRLVADVGIRAASVLGAGGASSEVSGKSLNRATFTKSLCRAYPCLGISAQFQGNLNCSFQCRA